MFVHKTVQFNQHILTYEQRMIDKALRVLLSKYSTWKLFQYWQNVLADPVVFFFLPRIIFIESRMNEMGHKSTINILERLGVIDHLGQELRFSSTSTARVLRSASRNNKMMLRRSIAEEEVKKLERKPT